VQTYATLARFVLGFAIQLRSEGDRPSPSAPDGRDLDALAATTEVTSIGRVPLTDEFDYGLHLMITGLRVHREQN
jgi:TetR/AcrR family tetracycline transcriptional repressor